MKQLKHIGALFLVTLFLSLKITGLHVISHHGDDDGIQHCEMCEISTTVSFTPLISSFNCEIKVEQFLLEINSSKIEETSLVYFNKTVIGYVFTRPPPAV